MKRYMKDPDNGELIMILESPDADEIRKTVNSHRNFGCSKKKGVEYYDEFMTFDIETTSLEDRGLMYLWGLCLGNDVFEGRTWENLLMVLERVRKHYQLNENRRMVIYVFNLAFEFQFIRNFFEWDKVFAVDKRVPVTALTGGFEFRCAYKLTNMSLAKFCAQSKSCIHYKKSGELFDYHALRFPDTELEDYHYLYQYCDVKGFHEAMSDLLIDDTLATIPLTSTGYVRREARRAMLSNSANKELITNTQLSPFLYLLMRTGRRGGDVHALAQYSDEIIENVDSWDIKSSYPYVMMTQKFPMTPFMETSRYRDDGSAYIMEVEFFNIRLKSIKHIPYIPVAKCIKKQDFRNDNGRIMTAKVIRTVITDIDMKIINNVYTYDDVEYVHVYTSEYGMLPKEYREYIRESFQTKTDLEDGDPYYYAKQKNKTNALFGMLLTDICQTDVIYDHGWRDVDYGVEKLLARYYSSKNSFLAYQWGLWVTAHGRYRLHEPTNSNLGYLFYSDTDSWKCRKGYNRSVFDDINKRVIAEASTFDVEPYAMKKGERVYLGVWSYEGRYEKFKTMGAKKYCYIKNGELYLTVAGLSKEKGAEYLKKHGGIEAFKAGLVVPEKYSGRTFSVYHDVDEVSRGKYAGHEYVSGSSVAIHETTYRLGKTDEYDSLLEEIKQYGIEIID